MSERVGEINVCFRRTFERVSPPIVFVTSETTGINFHVYSRVRYLFVHTSSRYCTVNVVHEILTQVVTVGLAFRVKITRSIIASCGEIACCRGES